jgi:hypothetical protein
LKVCEFWQDIEGGDMRRDSFGDEIDSLRCTISKESTGAIQMPHTIRIQTHQPRTREVGGNGIVSENELTQASVSAL